MNKFLLITTLENIKIIARYIKYGDRWGSRGEFIWTNKDDSYDSSLHDGIEFYLYGSENNLQPFHRKLGEWITRFNIEDFEDWVNEQYFNVLEGNTGTEIQLSDWNVICIQQWIKSMV